MMNLDESTLIAYVDGELDHETTREVEAQLGNTPDARVFVERLREIAALSRVAFNDTLHEPIPQHLRDTVINTITLSNTQTPPSDKDVVTFQPRQQTHWGKALPMAAAIGCLLLGLGGGFQYAEIKAQNSLQLVALAQMQDQIAMETQLNNALEANLSGNELAWRNPDSGRSATFTPIRTYQDKSGQYCREYRKDITTDGHTETTFGLACRTGEGTWKTKYLILENGLAESL